MITLITCGGIYTLIIIGIMFNHDSDKGIYIGLAGLCLAIFYLVIGIILSLIRDTRPVGSAILLSAGIIFLIGLSVCSFGSNGFR